jgi:hypothetical protein
MMRGHNKMANHRKSSSNNGSKVRKHRAFLTYAASLGRKDQKKLFRNASSDEVKAICEICSNIKNGRLPVNKSQFARLCLYKQQIRCMSDKKTSIKSKRKILNGSSKQTGGFIGALLGIALPLLASIIGKATSK